MEAWLKTVFLGGTVLDLGRICKEKGALHPVFVFEHQVFFFYTTTGCYKIVNPFPIHPIPIVAFHSLKFKITIHLALVILMVMLLSHLVMVYIVHKQMVQEWMTLGERALKDLPDPSRDPESWPTVKAAEVLLKAGPLVWTGYRLENGLEGGYGEPPHDLEVLLKPRQSTPQGSAAVATRFFGESWVGFFPQSRYALMTAPIQNKTAREVGVKALVIDLERIALPLRRSQPFIVFYMAANFCLILLFAAYRLSRLIIRPLRKFIKLTDDYKDKDRLYFFQGRKYEEFKELSTALNQMIGKIETNKQSLQEAYDQVARANRELRQAQDEIIRAEKLASVGRLSAGIAHEIGNPIGIVLGYIDLLKSRSSLKADATAQDFLQRAGDEIGRVHQVIRQLLDFSRAAPGRLGVVAMNDLVSEVAAVMTQQPLMADIAVECRLDAPRDRVYGDDDRMRQVLVNLMINSADAIHEASRPEGGVIRLSSETLDPDHPGSLSGQPTFALRVSDNGKGIAAADIDNIFDPFFTTKAPGKGTGLGLSVSYTIINQSGGRMAVESEPGGGTVMAIYLPLHQEEERDHGKTDSYH